MFENEYKWMNEQTTYQKHLMESVPKWNQPLSHYIWQRIFFFLLLAFVFVLANGPNTKNIASSSSLSSWMSEFQKRIVVIRIIFKNKKQKSECARRNVCSCVLAYVCGMSDKMEKYEFSGECESHHLNKNKQLQESEKRRIIIITIRTRNLRRFFLFVAHTNAHE